jgi:hypothetical protein
MIVPDWDLPNWTCAGWGLADWVRDDKSLVVWHSTWAFNATADWVLANRSPPDFSLTDLEFVVL